MVLVDVFHGLVRIAGREVALRRGTFTRTLRTVEAVHFDVGSWEDLLAKFTSIKQNHMNIGT